MVIGLTLSPFLTDFRPRSNPRPSETWVDCHAYHLLFPIDAPLVAPLDIVIDVGGIYSPEAHRYDHHQRGFTEVFGYGGYDRIKLSSAGLVYKWVTIALPAVIPSSTTGRYRFCPC